MRKHYADRGAKKMSDEAKKFDDEKIRLELLPFAALEEIGKVFTYGAKKYADHNYRLGMKRSRLLAAALRHLFMWSKGVDRDEESGHYHLAHAGCCVLMLIDAHLHNLGTDDRWKP